MNEALKVFWAGCAVLSVVIAAILFGYLLTTNPKDTAITFCLAVVFGAAVGAVAGIVNKDGGV